MQNDRLYPAAEEIFRVIETSLEAMLYYYGVKKIEYPGRKRSTGRLALQFLIRDTLMNLGRIDRKTYDKYLEFASELHKAGYMHGKSFGGKVFERRLELCRGAFLRGKIPAPAVAESFFEEVYN